MNNVVSLVANVALTPSFIVSFTFGIVRSGAAVRARSDYPRRFYQKVPHGHLIV